MHQLLWLYWSHYGTTMHAYLCKIYFETLFFRKKLVIDMNQQHTRTECMKMFLLYMEFFLYMQSFDKIAAN